MLGQRIVAHGPDIAPLRTTAQRIIRQSPGLAPMLHIIEMDDAAEPDGPQTLHTPTVITLDFQTLIVWADAESVYGHSPN